MGKKIGFWLFLGGQLLIVAALCLIGYNVWDEVRVQKITDLVIAKMESTEEQDIAETEEEEILQPAYILNPDMEMPQQEIDGQRYIGILEIPAYGVKLPVISQWSYPSLRISPCRYAGSAYTDDLIISAHNYNYHFGVLKNLEIGDIVSFTDMDGNLFRYCMVEREILMPTDIEYMKSGEWDLTLFTCTLGGQYRVTVRFERIEDQRYE